MHAVVARSTLQDSDQARAGLKDTLIPRLREMPGFVSGNWVMIDATTGASLLTFETAEAAQAWVEVLKTNPPAGVTINSVEVGEVVGSA